MLNIGEDGLVLEEQITPLIRRKAQDTDIFMATSCVRAPCLYELHMRIFGHNYPHSHCIYSFYNYYWA